uniref:Secondary thiamine-phosphate synthase enzyme n=1 Tax=Glycine max TaxID=3847 RepID=A0A0R0G1N2_SOYBN
MQVSSICLPAKVPVRVKSLHTNPATVNDPTSTAKVAAPKWAQKTITLPPLKRGCHLITSKIVKEVRQELSEYQCGLAHLFWPDDMPAHIKSSMFGCALMIPISNGKLNMGTWQGIWLCEHRDYPTPRTVVVTLNGI